MSNPYAAPDATPAASAIPPQSPHYSTVIHQGPVFSILLMVHGGLVTLMGLGIAMMAIMVPWSIAASGEGMDAEEEMMLRYMTIGYGVAAAGVGIVGLLQIWAGWKFFQFKGRTLAFVGIGAAFCSALTCYCALTGIPMGIWGLILLLHPDVRYAFELGERGVERSQILSHFTPPAARPFVAPQPPTAQTPPPDEAGPSDPSAPSS